MSTSSLNTKPRQRTPTFRLVWLFVGSLLVSCRTAEERSEALGKASANAEEPSPGFVEFQPLADGGYATTLAMTGVQVRFGTEGAVFEDEIGDVLTVQLEKWGVEGDLMSLPETTNPQQGMRLEWDRDEGLTEWWQTTEAGLEQGWTVAASPGEGPLFLELRLDGATNLVSWGDGARFEDASGRTWNVSGVRAWDAENEPVPAVLESEGDRMRVVVQTEGVHWPLTIDPVYTTASTTLVGGALTNIFGTSVASAGDVNGDGYDDVIVGAPGYSSSTGRAYLYLGAAAGVSTTASMTWTGSAAADYFGYSVASAGDVNGDGYADVMVGAYGVGGNIGKVYVYYGSKTGSSSSPDVTLTGGAAYGSCTTWFGYSVSGAGDVDGDGYDDVMVGASSEDTSKACENVGRVYLFRGSSAGLSTSVTSTVTGATKDDRLGTSIAGAGDVNNDGYADLLMGSIGYGNNVGIVYVYHGSSTAALAAAAATYKGAADNYYFGCSVAGAGDVNNDGYDDVIIGAYRYSSYTGRAYVYPGSSAGLSATANATLSGVSSNNNFGFSVASAGDVNHDGYSDVVVGASGYSSSTGRAYLYEGSATGISTTVTTTLSGASFGAAFGSSVASAGDVNGDGYDDVIIGSPNASYTYGTATIYLGYAVDADGDGLPADKDCNDADASIGAASNWYGDKDGDGYGNAANTTTACTAPTSYVGNASDCDDGNAAINPAAIEVCDAADTDENCDGLADDASASGRGTFYQDADGDGYGGLSVTACDSPTGYILTSGDCDDATAAVNPGAAEICDANNVDEDCDGLVNDADPSVDLTTGYTFYPDADGDSFGDASSQITACSQPKGTATNPKDCDDSRADVNPNAAEVCDAADVDEDCDGAADDADASVTGQQRFYQDQDGDGYGDTATAVSLCDVPTGSVAVGGDCDDNRADVSPAASEVCDGGKTDEDCDGLIDDADPSTAQTGMITGYADADGDGFGDAGVAITRCSLPAGYVLDQTDCDDSRADISPNGQEVCDADNVDEDCDGLADDADSSATGQSLFYADADGDGYGVARVIVCDATAGVVADGNDCDDADPAISPGAQEICDAADRDEDCDGLADDADPSVDPGTFSTFYADTDGDTFGDAAAVILQCDGAAGLVTDYDDCDDSRSDVHPGTTEVCDGGLTDEDCNGLIDDDDPIIATGFGEIWYWDADGDGYGDATQSVFACVQPAGATPYIGDCDETRADVHPGAPETDCTDPTDYNCDGSTGTADVDGDGTPACQDCNDSNTAISPTAQEVCDASDIDDDCDGLADDLDSSVDPSGFTTGYPDGDADGYGTGAQISACDPGAGISANNSDCDDARADIHPGAAETDCTDPTDYNCDGSSGSSDLDADGTPACLDCNDNDAAVNPGAQERCDPANTDEDCDGVADDADSSVDPAGYDIGYTDGDADGYGAGDPVSACDLPAGSQAETGDCDDANPAINPSASEECNNEDDNCDGMTDEGLDCQVVDDIPADSGQIAAIKGGGGIFCGCAASGDAGGAQLALLGLLGLTLRRRRRA